MKYGCCIHPDFIKSEEKYLSLFKTLAQAGFDYVELPFFTLSQLTNDELEKLKNALQVIPCKACNVFFPPGLTLVGPEMDMKGIRTYLERMLPLAADLSVETLVFGNGGARRIPEEQDPTAIWDDLCKIVEEMEIHAKKEGITIAVEPLNTTETNMITSYSEAVRLTEGLVHVTAMIDSYHTAVNGQTYDDVYMYPKSLGHLHTAYPTGRMVPSPQDDMSLYADFVKMVKDMGYRGKISVEGALRSIESVAIAAEYKACIDTLKHLLGDCEKQKRKAVAHGI
ncbi:MAG: sugar phosphate isomerase/epimerase [Defluviitaleaceae bacterium]|nr:sugar phosphate isomerase/epimerase [Defluviitaleaceae bacterium]